MASLASNENRPDEWTTAGREAQHRLQLRNWNDRKESWSGSGKHVKDNEIRYTMPSTGEELGNGNASVVEKIHYRSLPLARKSVWGNRYRPISELRQEVDIMEKIVHHHIVVLVGSYTSTLRKHKLYLLIYPAATCDLKTFLHDIDDIRHGSSSVEASKRFESLGFKELLPKAQSSTSSSPTVPSIISWSEPLRYLRSILGCITEAVVYIHDRKIRHRDLKPENILLTPKRVYVADFGISRNLENASNSLTEGYAGGTRMYQAPEASEKQEHHMSPSEIYSLGAIFLSIATVLYNENQSVFDSVMKESVVGLKASRITAFLHRLRHAANCNEDLGDSSQTHDWKHIIGLIETMLDYDPNNRPTALEVSHSLVELGGQDQIYHEKCCRKDATQIAKIQGFKIKSLEGREALQSQELRELRTALQLNDAKVNALEKELGIVKDGFESRLATEKRDLSNSWQHHLDAEKRKHEATKAELESARRRIKKFEEDNQSSHGRKDKRNHLQNFPHRNNHSPSVKMNERDGASTPSRRKDKSNHLRNFPHRNNHSPSVKMNERGRASTRSRIPIRNSASPHTPPPLSKAFAKLIDAKAKSDLNPNAPLHGHGSNESEAYSQMMASGITLVESSASSASPRSSPPASPSMSRRSGDVQVKVDEPEATLSVPLPSSVSRSYADILKPTTAAKTHGLEPSTTKPKRWTSSIW